MGSRVMYPGDYNGVAQDIKGTLKKLAWSGGCTVELDEPIKCPEYGTIREIFTNVQMLQGLPDEPAQMEG